MKTVNLLKPYILLSFVSLNLALTACGGGGSNKLTGQLVDAPVSGIHYRSDSGSGTTSDDGEFRYKEGETITFSLGDTRLGSATGNSTITLFDLAGISPPRGDELRETIRNYKKPIQRVINTAVLLQSLDADADLSNGIEISPEVAALFDGVSVKLDRSFRSFRNQADFRTIFNQAKADALLSNDAIVRRSDHALQHLYESTGTDSNLFTIRVSSNDDDADGTTDFTSVRQYNRYGNLIRSETDRDADGIADSISYFQYNGNGYRIRFESDQDADGSIDSTTASQYDNNDNLTREDRRSAGVLTSSHRYQYDIFGNVIHIETDHDGDGNIDSISDYQYNKFGNQVLIQSDYDVDGVLDYIRNDQYDDFGNIIRTTTDNDADGSPEIISHFIYNEDGYLMSTEDNNMNATEPLVIRTYYYEGDNRVRNEYDSNGDGSPETIQTYQYDNNGNVTLYEDDSDADSTVDFITRYQYDNNGYRTRLSSDYNTDGSADYIVTYRNDNKGNPLQVVTDRDADGVADSIADYEYIAAGMGILVED